MKRFYLSIAVLLAVLALCFAGAYTITSRSDIVGAEIDNVKQYAEKEDYAGAAQAAQRLCDSWSLWNAAQAAHLLTTGQLRTLQAAALTGAICALLPPLSQVPSVLRHR